MKTASATTSSVDPMKSISEIFASGDQWILPPIPLLDEEFDGEENLGEDNEIPSLYFAGRAGMAHN